MITLTTAKAVASQRRMPILCMKRLLTQSRPRPGMGESPRMRTLVFIPAWNEEASVTEVIADVREHMPDADVLVVDDGSTDATAERAREAGAMVAPLPFNQGLGAALQTGYLYALREGYDCCAHLDSDGQHPASEVARLLAEVVADDADLVIGSRYHERRRRRPTATTTGRRSRGGSAPTSSASSSPWRPASASPTRPAACGRRTAG